MRRRTLWGLLGASLLAEIKTDRGIGKWRFVREDSTYESGPAPRESLRQWKREGEGVRFLHDGSNAAGQPFHTEFTAQYDGKPYPFQGGSLYNAVALHWRSADQVDQVFTQDGRVTVTATRRISPDGQRMTIDSRGALPSGKRFRNLLVYQRVE